MSESMWYDRRSTSHEMSYSRYARALLPFVHVWFNGVLRQYDVGLRMLPSWLFSPSPVALLALHLIVDSCWFRTGDLIVYLFEGIMS